MKIVTKIWLGFNLLIAGFILTLALTELNSRNGEEFLHVIEVSSFPCANAAQGAITEFKQQILSFQDAVVLGDVSGIERARALQAELSEHLASISSDPLIAVERRQAVESIEQQIKKFIEEGAAVYTRLAKNDPADGLSAQAAKLTTRSNQLNVDLERLRDDLRQDLRTAIASRSQRLKRDRFISELVFSGVLIIAGTLIAAVMFNFSSRLRLLIGASERLTSGDYQTPIIDMAHDEVSQLGHGFEAMRSAIAHRSRELLEFNASLDGLVRDRTHELEKRNLDLHTQITERQRAERSLRLIESAIDQIDEGIAIVPVEAQPVSPLAYSNPGFLHILQRPADASLAGGLIAVFGSSPVPDNFLTAWTTACTGIDQTVEVTLTRGDGTDAVIEWHIVPLRDLDGRTSSIVSILRDLTERKREEAQRHQGQKMESIGQLAAGVAHEINTPIQFIGDNLRFLSDSFTDLGTVLDAHAQLLAAVRSGTTPAELITATDSAVKRADVEYLTDEIPKAITQSLEGVTRVAEIVRAMKEFSHPDQGEKKPTDLNKAILTTLTVARNEYKYVADLVTDFAADLPAVPCIVGEFNQVVLNLVVNAAHAISDVIAKSGGKGVLTITTQLAGAHIEVRIRDTGTGIPVAARVKIFDPFFTTKAVGKGTGQGLYIAHSVIAKKHGGTLTFETEIGQGTTFCIRLPLEPVSQT